MLLLLVSRNLLRSPTRALLSILAVAIATFAFVFLRTVVSSMAVQSTNAHDTLVTRQSVSLLQRLPIKYVEEVRATPGVSQAMGLFWFGGEVVGKPDVDMQSFAVEPESFFAVYGDRLAMDGAARDDWKKERQGVIVGKKLADDLKAKVGDRLALGSGFVGLDPPVSFVVSGIFVSQRADFDERTLYARQDYLSDSLAPPFQNQVSVVVSRIAPGVSGNDVARRIDAHFDDHDLTTTTEDEEAFAKNMVGFLSTVVRAINVISTFLLLLIGMVVANALAMSVRERTSEYGALRAVGFKPLTIIRMIVGESVLLCLVGTGLGLALVWTVIKVWVGPFVTAEAAQMFAEFRIEPITMLIAFGASMGLGALAGFLPGWLAMRVKTVDALRGA